MNFCTGKWTWTRTVLGEEKKSILDYIILDDEISGSVNEANIDEAKEITPYRDDHGNGRKRVYADHRAITANINTSILDIVDNRKKKIISQKGYKKFAKLLKQHKVTEIWKEESCIKKMYTKWSNK